MICIKSVFRRGGCSRVPKSFKVTKFKRRDFNAFHIYGSAGLNSQSAWLLTPVFIVAIVFLSLKDMIAIIEMGDQKSHADWLFNHNPVEPIWKVGTFLPTGVCPRPVCPHKKSKFGVHVFVNKHDFRGLGRFLWAKSVGKMCGQNQSVAVPCAPIRGP